MVDFGLCLAHEINDPTHCQLIFNHLYFASFEAMQCPDVVVANLDTHSFLGKQTVHVSEVVYSTVFTIVFRTSIINSSYM